MDALKKGIVYTYKIRVFKAPLSERLTKVLEGEF